MKSTVKDSMIDNRPLIRVGWKLGENQILNEINDNWLNNGGESAGNEEGGGEEEDLLGFKKEKKLFLVGMEVVVVVVDVFVTHFLLDKSYFHAGRIKHFKSMDKEEELVEVEAEEIELICLLL